MRSAPTPKRLLQSPWVLSHFLAGNSVLHNVRGFCRGDGSWFGTMLTPRYLGFCLDVSSKDAFSALLLGGPLRRPMPHFGWECRSSMFEGGRRERKDEAFKVHADYKLLPCLAAVRNINADPHLHGLSQLQLDKVANKEKCLLRPEKANEKLPAATGEET